MMMAAINFTGIDYQASFRQGLKCVSVWLLFLAPFSVLEMWSNTVFRGWCIDWSSHRLIEIVIEIVIKFGSFVVELLVFFLRFLSTNLCASRITGVNLHSNIQFEIERGIEILKKLSHGTLLWICPGVIFNQSNYSVPGHDLFYCNFFPGYQRRAR